MKEKYFEVYCFVSSLIFKIVRAFLFVGSISLLCFRFQNHADVKSAIAIFALVVINELFAESLSKIVPLKKVSDNSQNNIESMIFSARKAYNSGKTGNDIVNNVLNNNAVRFFKQKIGIEELVNSDVTPDELLKQSYEAVVWVDGNYISEVDLFASYILLSETTTHFLENGKLNNDDVMSILYWARRTFEVDKFENNRMVLLGPGVFDPLVFGWNYELKKYSKDLTWEVLSRRFTPTIIGEEKTFKELEIALSKKKSANAIIVGEPGTGKTSLVEYLAYVSFLGEVNEELYHKKIYELLVDKLLSGVGNAGELEQRISEMLAEISHNPESVVFIQNIENIFGGGGFGFDISGVLDEYLNSDKVKIIGTTTPAAYSNFIRGKTAISDLFEEINLPEPTDGKTLLLLTDKACEVEQKYKLKIKYPALKQSVVLSQIYFPDNFNPGRSLGLLEDSAARIAIEKKKDLSGDDVLALVQSKTNVVLDQPDSQEKDKLMHLEEKLHLRIIGQEEAVSAISDAMRRLRSGFKDGDRPISVFLFLGPTGVGKTETAKALALEYFGSEEAMIRLDMSEYQNQDQITRILGGNPGGEYIENSLVEQVEKNPFSLVLLDEFEKANSQLLNIFLQIFDEGRVTSSRGSVVSFKNTIIIVTSNAGAELIRENESISKSNLVDYLLKNNLFKPELINRFDEVVLFKSLTEEQVKKVASLLLTDSLIKLVENQINISFDDKALSKIAKDSYSVEFGARNIRRYIEENVESFLSKQILEDKIPKNTNLTLSVDDGLNFIVT